MSKPDLKVDIAIIGAGSGGLSVAAGASQMGASTVLIEKGKMGGDCLNYGCVPSKALIAAGEAAQTVRKSGKYGVNGHEPEIDFASVNKHVHDVIAGIAPHDSVERFEGLGVNVIQGEGRFVDETTIEAGGKRIKARRIVISTGSSAFVPPIPGLDDTPYLTNETIFDLTDRPEHLVIIGGGPIGIELAQAHRRLGSEVTVLEGIRIMGNDDPDAVEVVRQRLVEEGVTVHEGAMVKKVARSGNGVSIEYDNGETATVEGSHLLLAVGRRPNVNGLNLEKAGIEYSPKGIPVDDKLRTSNKKVFAIGDVIGGLQFTHVAGYHAGVIIRQAMFNMFWAKANHDYVPWVTYTDPELAHVGLNEKSAREKYGDVVKATSWKYEENDRARAEKETEGFIKVVTGKRGKILGATIVGLHAGELLMPWIMATQKGFTMADMSGFIAPYPTLSEVSKRVAGAYFTPSLFSDKTRKVVGMMQKLP